MYELLSKGIAVFQTEFSAENFLHPNLM